jgi:cellulose synthase/poly-beta-1,6-N-acetylglucosamine synthase-like glycosyltransferase
VIRIALDVLFTAFGVPVLGCSTYLAALAMVAAPVTKTGAASVRPRLRFDIVVPAHDEEIGVAATIESLLDLDYPKDLYRVIVIADNCTDATARVAAAAGALVIERNDPSRRGKGHALAYAFARLQEQARADAFVVVDADTTASPNLLRAFAERLGAGAGVLQAAYGVRNPEASWRTRLMVIALDLFHGLRSLARERLGLSTGLRGNGMAFSREVLRKVPPNAFSIVEDVEYGLALGEAGYRVHYVPEAVVSGDIAPRGGAAASQRRRWEQGRAALARAHGARLLREGLRRRDAVLVDLALDLLVPPLASIALCAAAGTALSIAWHRLVGGSLVTTIPWLLSTGFLAAYVLRGISLSGAGLRGVCTLLWAPAYVVWKLGLKLRRPLDPSKDWIRTAREGER